MAADSDPYNHMRHIGFLLRKAYQRNMTIFQRSCTDPQLTSVQLATLNVLAASGPCSLTVLGREAATDPATTRGVVERLKDRDFISLSSDPGDRRKVIVTLRAAGKRCVDAMVPVLPRISEETMQALNVAERIALQYLLTKLTAAEDVEEG
jgi:MarR family transcriptional regulator, lower aerobic nicotinate degradation pathway regulator